MHCCDVSGDGEAVLWAGLPESAAESSLSVEVMGGSAMKARDCQRLPEEGYDSGNRLSVGCLARRRSDKGIRAAAADRRGPDHSTVLNITTGFYHCHSRAPPARETNSPNNLSAVCRQSPHGGCDGDAPRGEKAAESGKCRDK